MVGCIRLPQVGYDKGAEDMDAVTRYDDKGPEPPHDVILRHSHVTMRDIHVNENTGSSGGTYSFHGNEG
jgi:hypothetical protein